jgi:hypothetical protein
MKLVSYPAYRLHKATFGLVVSPPPLLLWAIEAHDTTIALMKNMVSVIRSHLRPEEILRPIAQLIVGTVKLGCDKPLHLAFGCSAVLLWKWHSSTFLPLQVSAFTDRIAPPETITHTVQDDDGKVERYANDFRKTFTLKSFNLEKTYLAKENLHKYAARRRLAVANMIQGFAKTLGLTIYDEQMSRRSLFRELEGCRTIMDAKDACSYVSNNLKYGTPKPGSLVMHIDTFTHKSSSDANYSLSDGNIHLLYTWNPTCVAGNSDEINFRYNDHGNLITEVEGSDPYCDTLWDFEDDCLVTYSHEFSFTLLSKVCALFSTAILFSKACELTSIHNRFVDFVLRASTRTGITAGIMSLTAVLGMFVPFAMSHKVIRLDVGEHRAVVAIVPNCKFRGLAALARPFLQDKALKTRQPYVGVTKGGHKFVAEKRKANSNKKTPSGYSVAYLESNTSYFVDDAVFDTTKCLTTDKGDPSIPNVRITTKSEGEEANRIGISIAIALAGSKRLQQSYSSNYGYYKMPTIMRLDDEAKADGADPKEPMAHGAMPEIVTGAAFIHLMAEAQTRDFVQRRLRDPAAKINTRFTPETVQYIAEFAALTKETVIGDKDGFLEPISEEEYIETRKKTQLNKFYDVIPIYDINNYDDREGFMKREVLSDPAKAARGICCHPASNQAKGGRISLAYAAAMKVCPWMACGLNPADTTEAVVRVCFNADYATETDFSAQDATIDEDKRNVELLLLKELFHRGWHYLIENWHYTDYCGRVLYGPPGTKREAHEFKWSRGSGSPFTTYGNTPLTALFAYIALRLSGLTDREAWNALGIYSGDDGITPNLPPESCDKAAALLGFLVKSAKKVRYIGFLGRNYFDPIHGSYSSIQSPLRTLSKLHTTLLNIDEFTAEETMLMKAICLQVTDKHSDFFGPWSRKVLEDAHAVQIASLKAKVLKYPGLHPYFAIKALETNATYVNEPGDFIDLFELEMPGFDWSKFECWLNYGKGPCPTLWEHPEVPDEKMIAVGPVTLAMRGTGDLSHYQEYPGPAPGGPADASAADSQLTPPKRVNPGVKKKRSKHKPARNPAEQKAFIGVLKENGLYDEYRAAKMCSTDSDEIEKEKRSIRVSIERKVKELVHKPRCQ